MTEKLIIITPAQCRAARELLNWGQEKLSKESNISQGTISRFENSNNKEMLEFKVSTLLEILNTLRNADIEFVNDGNRIGVFLG